MRTLLFSLALSLMALFIDGVWCALARAQTGGDQILDGIGETSLVARFVFDGNARVTATMQP